MKYVLLGRYTEQGLAGFVKNPNDNRMEAAKKITEAAGGKLIDMMLGEGLASFHCGSGWTSKRGDRQQHLVFVK